MKMHNSTQLGPERHCKTQAESPAQRMRLRNKQKKQLGNNKLPNTQPDAPLAPHTTVCGPSTTPGELQRAGFANNHRRYVRHRHRQCVDVDVCVCVASLAPHTTGPTRSPLRRARCTNNHQCYSQHRQQQSPPSRTVERSRNTSTCVRVILAERCRVCQTGRVPADPRTNAAGVVQVPV